MDPENAVEPTRCECPDCHCEELTTLEICPACRAALHAEEPYPVPFGQA